MWLEYIIWFIAYGIMAGLIFAGLVILQLNGLKVALWKWAEVVLFYYSLELYIQHRQPRVSL